jgi:hypothetical protein
MLLSLRGEVFQRSFPGTRIYPAAHRMIFEEDREQICAVRRDC